MALGLALALQLASATWLVSGFLSPNASTEIARTLAATGRYEGGNWSLLIGGAEPPSPAPRMYQLPGEALYLAFWFRYLPQAFHRYAHVPVTTLLVAAVSVVALHVGGVRVAAAAAVIGSTQPFTVLHGPVWDDAFLAAALLWVILGILTSIVSTRGWGRHRRWTLPALAALSAAAGVTRTLEACILLFIALALLLLPSSRSWRHHGLAILVGLLAGLSAWGFRNQQVVGEFAVSSSHDGLTLYQSLGPMAVPGIRRGQVERYMSAETMGTHWERAAGMTEPDLNRYYVREAVVYALTHPLELVTTAVLKIGISSAGVRPELPIGSFRNLAALTSNLALISLAGVWLVLLWRRRMSVEPPIGVLLAVIVIVVAFFLAVGPIGWRYRIAVDGVLWIGSACVLTEWLMGYRRSGAVSADGQESFTYRNRD